MGFGSSVVLWARVFPVRSVPARFRRYQIRRSMADTMLPITVLMFLILALLSPALAQAPQAAKAVYLAPDGVNVVPGLNSEPRAVTRDEARKYSVFWSPGGDKIAFLADTKPNMSLPLLTVVDPGGAVLAKLVLFDGHAPDTVGDGFMVPRAISILGWFDSGSVMLEGGLNRWVCELMVMSIRTGKVSMDLSGQCGSFLVSPDRTHVLTQSNMRYGPEEEWTDGIGVDHRQLYPVGTLDSRLLADPVWSPDSQTVALVERVVATGEKRLVLVDLSGKARRVSLSATTEDIAPLEWVDSKVVVKAGNVESGGRSGRWRTRSSYGKINGRVGRRT